MKKKSLHLYFYGEPISKARHRSTRGGRMYSPQTEVEAAFRWELKRKLPENYKPSLSPFKIKVIAVFARPKSHYGTGRNSGKLKASAPKFCTNAKDADNILKFVCDAMNMIVYKDDRQGIEMCCEKHWADKDSGSQTIVEITFLDND